ncbi:MAG: hypothetical protein LBV03_02605 [Fusobacteriales bacterium]|nr:hypothetical protein [Fusobacteriales bacterium]
MKKLFFIIGIISFILLAIGSLVTAGGGKKLSEEKSKNMQVLYEESYNLINVGKLKEAQKKIGIILNSDPKNPNLDWAYDLYDYLTMVIEDVNEFPVQAARLSDDELKKAKNGKLFKRYTQFEQLNEPLNKKINIYVKKNYNTLIKNKQESEKYEKKLLLEREKTEQIRRFVNNSSDDSFKPLVEYIKLNMNDPKSYEHVKTFYNTTDDKIVVIETTFRGKNKLGTLVINKCTARARIDTGQLLEVKCN